MRKKTVKENENVNEWVSEWVSECVCVCVCRKDKSHSYLICHKSESSLHCLCNSKSISNITQHRCIQFNNTLTFVICNCIHVFFVTMCWMYVRVCLLSSPLLSSLPLLTSLPHPWERFFSFSSSAVPHLITHSIEFSLSLSTTPALCTLLQKYFARIIFSVAN
jgi:hypothetical protein